MPRPLFALGRLGYRFNLGDIVFDLKNVSRETYVVERPMFHVKYFPCGLTADHERVAANAGEPPAAHANFIDGARLVDVGGGVFSDR